MDFVLASQNEKKRRELQEILQDFGITLRLQSELGVHIDVEETGKTFAENAQLKAQAVANATGLPALADDSGLVVDALDGVPGIYSARYGGETCQNDTERYELLLKNMQGKTDRACRFVCVICCAFPDGTAPLFAEGRCEGVIATKPSGDGGFGYDPIFYLPQWGKSMAELTAEEKHTISHRGFALRAFVKEWENYHGTDE